MPTPLRFSLLICILFGLAGCAGGQTSALFGAKPTRAKTIMVADFVVASEVVATDLGFNTRQESKGGNFPILERRQRTLARVNDEIVASIVATVRAAGLPAAPGNEQGLSPGDSAVLLSGRLHPDEKVKPSQMSQVGFGAGRGHVLAEMTLSRFSGGSKSPLTTFTAEVGRKGGPTGKAAAAFNAEVADALVAENASPAKLSPEVEGQARRLGIAIGEKVVALAKENGWMAAPVGERAAPDTVKLPEPKPTAKPKAEKKKAEKKPAVAKPADAKKPADADKPAD